MKVFQILNSEVLIIDGKQQYRDGVENFLKDSSLVSVPVSVIYDNQQKCCVVNQDGKESRWFDYPNKEFDGYIAKVGDYIAAKAKREYVPPTLDEVKQQAASYAYSQYMEKKQAIVYVDGLGFASDDSGQLDWQSAMNLITDKGQYKVYDADGKASLQTVTKEQLSKVGEQVRSQQLSAYTEFKGIIDTIHKVTKKEDLQSYLPKEMA